MSKFQKKEYRTVKAEGATCRAGSGYTDRQKAQRDRQMSSKVFASTVVTKSKLRPLEWLGVLSFGPLTQPLYELGGQMAADRVMAIEELTVLLWDPLRELSSSFGGPVRELNLSRSVFLDMIFICHLLL